MTFPMPVVGQEIKNHALVQIYIGGIEFRTITCSVNQFPVSSHELGVFFCFLFTCSFMESC